jgi:LmbE family N-acetylglucosaminyl deacetylase
MGAHYDDCVFGIPGIMVQAARRGFRVVILAMIGNYADFSPAAGRQEQFVARAGEIARDYGAELRFLDFQSHRFEVTTATKQAVAQVVADVQPEIAFMLWPHDHHGDHGPAARLSETALRHASQLLDGRPVRPVRRLYAYDNGPRHTIGFEPDTFVDVTREWPAAMEWLGRLMAHLRDRPYAPGERESAVELKETLAAYRGRTCGVRYAEALQAMNKHPIDILARFDGTDSSTEATWKPA